jgi:hypothetical protein
MFYAMQLEAERMQERIERDLAFAAARRISAPEPAPSIRRVIGRRFIRIGTRIAAEPSLESVRSR